MDITSMDKELQLFTIYFKGENITMEDKYETSSHPMHPSIFHQLSSVIGFNNLNGHTYFKYVEHSIRLEITFHTC